MMERIRSSGLLRSGSNGGPELAAKSRGAEARFVSMVLAADSTRLSIATQASDAGDLSPVAARRMPGKHLVASDSNQMQNTIAECHITAMSDSLLP
jgi:hypothetical protein